MPSTKTIAVAVAALAASGTQASACKPSNPPSSTTTSEASAPTCDEYTLNLGADADCGVPGDAKDNGFTIPSNDLEDCAKSCYDYTSFNCELLSFEAPETSSEQVLAVLSVIQDEDEDGGDVTEVAFEGIEMG
ncbi:hypothetical protein ACHAP5_003134 [Fusarium lateritium]